MHFDDIDRQILALVQRDGRLSQQEIARAVRLSQPAVAERLRKLEEKKVIVGWAAHVDPEKAGQTITAFVGVVIEHPKYFELFAHKIAEMPEVLECHRVAGDYTYLLKVRTASTRSLDRLLTEQLRMLEGVNRTHTIIALLTTKETTAVPIEDPESEEVPR